MRGRFTQPQSGLMRLFFELMHPLN